MNWTEADKLVHEFGDDAWYAFHQGDINEQDDFYTFQNQWIDNKVIYNYECKLIIDNLDYDVFQNHDTFGRANNWQQAAFAALYDLLNNHDDTVNCYEMEEVLLAD